MTLKTCFLLILMSMLQPVYSQNTGKTKVSEIDKAVLTIKRSQESFKKTITRRAMDGNSNSYREIFMKDKDLQIIAINNSEKKGEQERVEYYFSTGQLIYVEQIKAGTDNKISIERFYVDKGHLVAWFNDKDESIDILSPTFKAVDDTLGSYSDKLKKEL